MKEDSYKCQGINEICAPCLRTCKQRSNVKVSCPIRTLPDDSGSPEPNDLFCRACLEDRPAAEASPDPRYCQRCYDFLLEELDRVGPEAHGKWIPKMESAEQEHYDHWSEDERIFFYGGYGYASNSDGRTIPLGTEEEIEGFFKTGKLPEGLVSTQTKLLTEILGSRKGVQCGEERRSQGLENCRGTQPTTGLASILRRTALLHVRRRQKYTG